MLNISSLPQFFNRGKFKSHSKKQQRRLPGAAKSDLRRIQTKEPPQKRHAFPPIRSRDIFAIFVVFQSRLDTFRTFIMLKFERSPAAPPVLALGVFDGVHTGHRKIISNAAALAAKSGALPVAVTFVPHPREILGEPPQLLVPVEERRRLLIEAGAWTTGTINFSPEIAALEPEEFLEKLTAEVNPAGIVVGEHWRFGRGGRGNGELLKSFAASHDMEFLPCPELEMEGETVSSTAIRRHIAAGDLERATAMLGRPPAICGRVISGYGDASRRLDSPTANLDITCGIVPPDGVYAGKVNCDGSSYAAAINIGFSPTFDGERDKNERRIEVHLLDFNGSLYGRELAVSLLKYLRPERRFDSVEELKKQIAGDIKIIRQEAEKI